MIPTRAPRELEPSGPVVIGLTGPIACGKSTIARMLGDIGGTVIDADALARQVTEAGSEALPEIRARFGSTVFDGSGALDRNALGRIVFDDPRALEDLERIIHPRVRPLVDSRLDEAARERVPFVVLEAIKLVEAGLAQRCDEVWIVECAPETQRARLAGRGVAAEDAARRVASQGTDLAARLTAMLNEQATAFRRVSTDSSLDETREAVEETLAEVLDRRLG